jgi:signal transduction histidine kinase
MREQLTPARKRLRLRLPRARSLRAARRLLFESEAFKSEVLDSLPHEVAVVDPSGAVVAVNRRWERFAVENDGDPRRVSVGANYWAVSSAAADSGDPYARKALDGLGALRRRRLRDFSLIYPCHAPDQERWYLMYAACTEAEPFAIVISHTDITARVVAESAFLEATDQLREAARRKDEFLATLAHELRNPLAPIHNGLYVLQCEPYSREHSDRERKLLRMMERQAVHLTRLVDDLLDVSRITRGELSLKKAGIDLVEVLRQAIEAAQPKIDKGGHHLNIDLPTSPIVVDGDAVRLTQVFSNLLNNAANYTEHGGRITVSAKQRGDEAVVSVQDSGVGIPPEMQPHIFELFTQVDRTLGRPESGLGIGLALVKRLLELHGGSVEVQSDGLKCGSTFIVRIPLASKLSASLGLDRSPPQPI